MSEQAHEFAATGRLVPFVGAGVSSIPPTCLPSWWGMNQAVVAALRDRVAELVGAEHARKLAEAITARQEANRFPPEYQAEIIFRRLGGSYFTVLQSLDSDTPNDTHLQIAALAKAGRLAAVVTTNFDRALEAAFRTVGVQIDVWSDPGQFRTLADRLRETGGLDAGCPIIKLHGSTDKPGTLVDTLSQRKRGFAPQVVSCLRDLLRYAHWLFLGYSGADLMADENYLYLKPDASEASGFTWLLRTNEQPVAALTSTRTAYGDRAEIVHGELPRWLFQFSQPLLPDPPPRAGGLGAVAVEEVRRKASERVTAHARAWVASERFDRIVLVFADLLEAVSEPGASFELVQRLYYTRTTDERKSGHFGLVIDALANHHTQAGRFDEAVALFMEALKLYDPATAEEQHVAVLNNLALVYNKQGRTGDALDIYQRVLAFANKSGNSASGAVAMHNLAMIRHRLGENNEAEKLYLEELEIVRSLGDEPARAIALNNLGELEVSRRRLDRAGEYLKEAASVRDRIGDDLGAARARANLANALSLQGDYEPTLRIYAESLEVFTRFGERTEVARTFANLARVKENRGDRDRAMALVQESLNAASAIGADPIRAEALQLLGEIQQKQGRNQESAETFTELIELAVQIRDAKCERDALVGRAIALKVLNQISSAIALLREALALTERHRFPASEWVLDHLADALNLDGIARQQHDDLDGSLQNFVEALEIARQRRSPYNEGQTLINIGNTQAMGKKYIEAADTFERAASLLQADDHNAADEAALIAGDIYLQLDRSKDAGKVFRAIVKRATSYEERADRMNRIGELAEEQLQRGRTDRALRVMRDCYQWNLEDGFSPDAAACLINIGSILRMTGDAEGARASLQNALVVLKGQPQHPLVARAKALIGNGA